MIARALVWLRGFLYECVIVFVAMAIMAGMFLAATGFAKGF